MDHVLAREKASTVDLLNIYQVVFCVCLGQTDYQYHQLKLARNTPINQLGLWKTHTREGLRRDRDLGLTLTIERSWEGLLWRGSREVTIIYFPKQGMLRVRRGRWECKVVEQPQALTGTRTGYRVRTFSSWTRLGSYLWFDKSTERSGFSLDPTWQYNGVCLRLVRWCLFTSVL